MVQCGEELLWLCHNCTTISTLTPSLPLETNGVDVFFKNENFLFRKCRPDTITYCLNSCCLKTSIPHTPQRAESAGLALEGTATKLQGTTQNQCRKTYRKNRTDQFAEKMLFINLKARLDFDRTNVRTPWNAVYTAIYRICSFGNESIFG